VEAAARPAFIHASRDLLRETVLDAVGELAAARPWSEVTMADVAAGAGVSRQTLYNSFGSRQELAQAYVLREAERFLAAIEGAVREAAPDPHAALRAAVEIFLSGAETHPVVRAVAASESGDELLPLLTTRGGPLVGEVTERLTTIMVEAWAGLPRDDAFRVADALVRLAISHAALPGGAPARTADDLVRVLGPCLDQLTAGLEPPD
jgi:AcrR family transcriptional regulator